MDLAGPLRNTTINYPQRGTGALPTSTYFTFAPQLLQFPMRLVFPLVLWLSLTFAHKQYCKCQCNEQLLIREIEKCGMCTKEWCIEQKLDLCAEGDENILISCFQVESLKEKVVVCLFLAAVLGLLGKSFFG